MYNKIASIILNSGKANGLSDVFIAQPDAAKENAAGKVFVLAEISGRKNDGRKVFDFLISAMNDNYYNDEKILLCGKIEGLKIENIFEAALAKTNKDLGDFLLAEKIKLNPSATNITLGIIYENKLHFSNFGRNRSLLIYRHGENFEIINVEANAAEAESSRHEAENGLKTPQLFSSVISGEIPPASYFVFGSEALPEYLSGKEMVSIITKLPPMTAAEQIKNVLTKINTYIPFLGIIVKNTTGLNPQELREDLEESLSAQSSISSLNYTEEKTEQMLAPAGLINFGQTTKRIKQIWKNLFVKTPSDKKSFRSEKYQPDHEEARAIQTTLDLGQIRSRKQADSFLIKEKMFFKKKGNYFSGFFKKISRNFISLFNPRFWSGLGSSLINWLKGLSGKNRLLFGILGAVLIILIGSIAITSWSHQRQATRDSFNNLVAQIEEKENTIDSHLLYNDEDGARAALMEARAILDSLPQERRSQREDYARLDEKLKVQEEKVQRLVKIEAPTQVNDLSGLGVKTLVFAAGKIYGASNDFIYSLTPNSASSTKNQIANVTSLIQPQFDKKDRLYYQADQKIAQFNIKTKVSSVLNVNSWDAAFNSFKIFNSNLYVLAASQNKIYRFAREANGFGARSDWLKETADLSAASDFFVDGDIYVLNSNGAVTKFFKGKKVDFSAGALSPVMTSANKLIVGTKYIYVFEATSKRLAVLAKQDGHLMNQYLVESLNDIKDIAVNEDGRAAYFLAGEAIYHISLNQ